MAELTNLETKLGEVLGLAMAAQGATEKVKKLDDLDGELAQTCWSGCNDEAKQAEERATEVAGTFEGKKTAILEEAREVKQKATEMMQDYLDRERRRARRLRVPDDGGGRRGRPLGDPRRRSTSGPATAACRSSSSGVSRSSSGTSSRSGRVP